MADDEVKILADAKKMPMAERVAHANWKARNAAYEDIKLACQRVYEESDPILTEYGRIHFSGYVSFLGANFFVSQGVCSPRLSATAMQLPKTRHLIAL